MIIWSYIQSNKTTVLVIYRLSLMRAIAMGLELEETYFDSVFAAPCAWMATWHYPPHPCENESWGVGPHTDHEVITILLQDDVGGLQIQTADGTWIDVPPILGNFRDILERFF